MLTKKQREMRDNKYDDNFESMSKMNNNNGRTTSQSQLSQSRDRDQKMKSNLL